MTSKQSPPGRSGLGMRSMLWALFTLLVGCAAPPAPIASNEALPLEQAIAQATDNLAAQTQKLPGLLAGMAALNKSTLLMDPSLDAASGQQTALTQRLDLRVTDRLRLQHPQFTLLPFRQDSLAKAQYLLVGTITRHEAQRNSFQIHLALAELKSGQVVAQASARARDDGLDTTPLPYYRDTPVLLVKDSVVEGYLRTAKTAPGQPMDAAYRERVVVATTIQEATGAYNEERYQEALGLYRSAVAAPAGEQMRAINGLYLSHWKLGHVAEAEQAFGQLVAMGLASRSLGVKFLFNPGGTDFWSDARFSAQYGLWLRQIARQAANAKVCLDVVGHTSRTGTEAYNDKLSAQRSASIQRRLEHESAALAGRVRTHGVGFRENLIGTGSDDASDALDRRVEFKVVGC